LEQNLKSFEEISAKNGDFLIKRIQNKLKLIDFDMTYYKKIDIEILMNQKLSKLQDLKGRDGYSSLLTKE